ncbi:MAG: hypothetical protein E7633_03065 [Ruminococcaceae bacterium]|nr:hypothetical protein [Oscillospiraceae bacterium]
MNKKISVIGGDIRQLYLAKELSKKGFSVTVYGIDIQRLDENDSLSYSKNLSEAAENAVMAILPIPFSRDKTTLNAPLSTETIMLSDIYAHLSDTPYIAAGLPDTESKNRLSDKSFLIDYAIREDFALKNALATVEGAIAIAIREMPTTLHGSVCAITGYGRIGKILVRALKNLGADVKVFARKNTDRISSEIDGAKAFDIKDISENIYDTDILINTVPSVIIDEKVLKNFPKSSIIIELASPPGGVDKHDAVTNGIRLVNAQSLPGKYSPKSAAKAIYSSIFSALSEEGIKI